eukprot:gene27417-36061_t
MKIYMCAVCGWIYDEAAGLPDHGIAPGTRWAHVPDDWRCPECNVGKADFVMCEMTDRRGFEYRNASGHGPKLVEEMSIFRFYMLYVDKYVKAFDKADRFCRMDKDPEEFAALLQRTVSDSNKEETITCDDVLGPKHASEHHTTDKRPSPTSESPSDGPTSSPTDDAQQGPSTSESSPTPANESASAPAASEGGKAAAAASTTDDAPLKSSTSESSPTPADDSASAPPASEGGKDGGQRDKTYSLLSYSFNLDPALRNEIGEEIASVVTDFELYVRMDCEPNPNPNPVSAWKPLSLQRGGVPRKQSIVTAISRDEKTFDYNAPLHGTPAAVQGLDIEEEGAPQTVRDDERAILSSITMNCIYYIVDCGTHHDGSEYRTIYLPMKCGEGREVVCLAAWSIL